MEKYAAILYTLLIMSVPGIIASPFMQETRNPKWAIKVNNISLNNMYWIDEGIYRSEQPSGKEFPELENFGIKEVLNLRSHHTDDSEAEGTNIKLHQVKMNAHKTSLRKIVQALKIIQNREGPILIHCQHGSDRTGLVVAMYRIVFQNWTKEEAIEELKNGGYGYHSIYFNIIRFINNADISNIRKELNLK